MSLSMRLFWMVSAAFMAGCVVGPEPVAPELSVPERFENSRTPVGTEAMNTAWWEGFYDPELTKLIELGLSQNLDIDIAAANLARARALVTANRSDLFPTLDAFVDAGLSSRLTGGVEGDADISAGGVMSYSPDIAGRTRRSVEAAQARQAAAALDLAEIRRLTAQAIAEQYIFLRQSGAALILQNTTLDLQTRTLEIVTARYDAGLSPALDVDRAAADLSRSQSQTQLLIADRKDAEYALSLLTGVIPESGQLGVPEEDVIPSYDSAFGIGVPADLLRTRPDIQAAEARLVAEIADIGVEEADLYPSLNLPGTLSAGRTTADNGVNAIFLNVSALLDIPFFDAGRREAEVDVQRAEADAALAAYRLALLDAIRETESALVRIEALEVQKRELEAAEQSSLSAFNQLNALYREGLTDFIDVLDVQRSLISTREAIISVDAALALAQTRLQTALYRSYDPIGMGQDSPS